MVNGDNCAGADGEQVECTIVHGRQSCICMYDRMILFLLAAQIHTFIYACFNLFRHEHQFSTILQNPGLHLVIVFFTFNAKSKCLLSAISVDATSIVKVRDCGYGKCNMGKE